MKTCRAPFRCARLAGMEHLKRRKDETHAKHYERVCLIREEVEAAFRSSKLAASAEWNENAADVRAKLRASREAAGIPAGEGR